ncbi:MAG: amino acid racemase [Bacteroidales bacterium]|nr:amino acid racemase [Bacteroidales bacterium]
MQTIGIIGGVGPNAGLDFVRNIFANTIARKDQEHLNCILISCSSIIPDRTEYLLSIVEENPAYGMFECAQRLYAAGANYVAVACNTAHSNKIFSLFRTMVEKSLPDFEIINMIETCATYAKKDIKPGNVKRIGLLATLGTHTTKVYHEYFKEEEGLLLIEPDLEKQKEVHAAIYDLDYGIKSYSNPITDKAREVINKEIHSLIERGAEAVILGCSELPLAVNPQDFDVPFLDPGLICARRLVEIVAPEKLTI